MLTFLELKHSAPINIQWRSDQNVIIKETLGFAVLRD